MKIRKVVSRTFGHDGKDVNVAGAINAVASADVNEADSHTRVSSRQRVVQRNGRTEVFEEEHQFYDRDPRSKEDAGD